MKQVVIIKDLNGKASQICEVQAMNDTELRERKKLLTPLEPKQNTVLLYRNKEWVETSMDDLLEPLENKIKEQNEKIVQLAKILKRRN